MYKTHAYTKTGDLYIISRISERSLLSTKVGWENSEENARKSVENLDEFYPCGEPKYVVIDKASRTPTVAVGKRIWYKRVGSEYVEFEGLNREEVA